MMSELHSAHDPQYIYSEFYKLTGAQFIKESWKNVCTDFSDIHYAAAPVGYASNASNHTVTSARELSHIMELTPRIAQDILHKLNDRNTYKHKYIMMSNILSNIENTKREFSAFLNDNTDLKEKYDELMVLFKLAGLKTALL